MQDLDGKTVPIGSLLSQEFFFRVPEYQRPFSWEADNFDDLIDDVITVAKIKSTFLAQSSCTRKMIKVTTMSLMANKGLRP